MTDSKALLELAARVEAVPSDVLVAERTKAILLEAWKATNPAPKPTRVPRQANGEAWSGDGLGPYTDEYSRWLARDRHFRSLIDAGGYLDAAMQLVPEGQRATVSTEQNDGGPPWAQVGREQSFAATPACALCAAALKARAQSQGTTP